MHLLLSCLKSYIDLFLRAHLFSVSDHRTNGQSLFTSRDTAYSTLTTIVCEGAILKESNQYAIVMPPNG